MSRKTMAITLITFFIALSAAFILYNQKVIKEHPKRLAVLGQPGHKVAPFSFTDQNGKTITNSDLRGKIYVVEYFFTTCEGICPKMNENMAKVYTAFRGNKEVEIMSHTVDPETDTVAQMKAYSMKFDADPAQWHFVTGSKHDLYNMAVNSYLLALEEDTSKNKVLPEFIHTPNFVLVDSKGFLRGKGYDGTSDAEVAELIADMKILLAEEAAEREGL